MFRQDRFGNSFLTDPHSGLVLMPTMPFERFLEMGMSESDKKKRLERERVKEKRRGMTLLDARAGISKDGRTTLAIMNDIEKDNAEGQIILLGLQGDNTRFPALQFESVLGAPSGQAVLFKGRYTNRHNSIQQDVAVKLFLRNDGTAERERDLMRVCTHPNVVSSENTYKSGDLTAMVFRLARGDLHAHVEANFSNGTPLEGRLLCHYAKQIAEGLAFMHSVHVAHLDIKAANVLVFSDDNVVITDFGLANNVSENEIDPLSTAGTLPFMAPELFSGRNNGSRPKVDVYAFGCMLWEILSGNLLFQAESVVDFEHYNRKVVIEKKSMANFIDSRWRRGEKNILVALISACCKYQPEQRITMAQVASRIH